MKKSFLFLLVSVFMCSCGNQVAKLNERVDSLLFVVQKKDNLISDLQKELNEYKYSPSKLLAEIKKIDVKVRVDYDEMNEIYKKMEKYHIDAPETAEAKQLLVQAEQKVLAKEKEEAEKAAKKRKAEEAKRDKVEKTMRKYDCTWAQASSILNHQVSIGMTREMCLAAWGRPYDINTTTTAYGVHEQWCYNGYNFLYFEDGILTNIQN